MGKAPAFQFYIRDWLADPQLKMASFSTKGIWIDVLCYMWEAPERGVVKGTESQLSRLIGSNGDEFSLFLDESRELMFCDISVTDNGMVTLCNRRMHREEKDRKNNRIRQERYREKQKCNAKITPPSSSSSSPLKKKDLIDYPIWLNMELWKEFKKMRVKIKKPMTEHAEKLSIGKLRNLIDSGENQDAVINQSIECNWQKFFPVKNDDSIIKTPKPRTEQETRKELDRDK